MKNLSLIFCVVLLLISCKDSSDEINIIDAGTIPPDDKDVMIQDLAVGQVSTYAVFANFCDQFRLYDAGYDVKLEVIELNGGFGFKETGPFEEAVYAVKYNDNSDLIISAGSIRLFRSDGDTITFDKTLSNLDQVGCEVLDIENTPNPNLARGFVEKYSLAKENILVENTIVDPKMIGYQENSDATRTPRILRRFYSDKWYLVSEITDNFTFNYYKQ